MNDIIQDALIVAAVWLASGFVVGIMWGALVRAGQR